MSPGLRGARRGVALVLLAVLGSVPAAPLALVADAPEGPYCAGDHCCCAPAAGDRRTCFRSVCGCGRGDEPALVALGAAVLPQRVVVPRLEGRRASASPDLPLPSWPDLVPPDHPPPLS